MWATTSISLSRRPWTLGSGLQRGCVKAVMAAIFVRCMCTHTKRAHICFIRSFMAFFLCVNCVLQTASLTFDVASTAVAGWRAFFAARTEREPELIASLRILHFPAVMYAVKEHSKPEYAIKPDELVNCVQIQFIKLCASIYKHSLRVPLFQFFFLFTPPKERKI